MPLFLFHLQVANPYDMISRHHQSVEIENEYIPLAREEYSKLDTVPYFFFFLEEWIQSHIFQAEYPTGMQIGTPLNKLGLHGSRN